MLDLFTITGAASGTLSELGVTGATLSFRSQAPDELLLFFPDPAHAAASWTADATVTLARSGTVVFRGKVRRQPRSGAVVADRKTVLVRGVWDELDRLPYAQAWSSWNGSAVIETADHARISLGTAGSAGLYTDTRAALTQLIAYAADKGVAIAAGTLPATRQVPVIEGHARTVGDLLRQVLRWHPDCLVWIDYQPTTPVLHVVSQDDAAAWSIAVGAKPVAEYDFALSDQAASNVVIRWEGLVDTWAGEADTSSLDPTERYRVQIESESAGTAGSTVGVGTILAVMPVSIPGIGAPTIETQVMGTVTIPDAAATDEAARQWVIGHTPLSRWGLTALQIRLPSTTAGDIVALGKAAVPLPDEETLGEDVELPAFWTDNLAKLPREILYGTVQPWMGRSYGRVACRATVGAAKVSVDALADELRAEAQRLARPETREIDGVECYLFDFEWDVAATNALSREYVSVTPGTPDGTVPPISEQIVTGLAAAYWDAISAPRWEGAVLLHSEEAGDRRWQGRCLNASGGLTAWQTMRAPVVAETWSLPDGKVRLGLGAPTHLSLQDFAEMARVAREPMVRREGRSFGFRGDPGDATLPAIGAPRVGPLAGPRETRGTLPPLSRPLRRWDVYQDGEDFKLRLGKLWDGATEITITSPTAALSAAAGNAVWLTVTGLPGLTTWTAALTSGSWPADGEYSVSSGVMTFYRKRLGDFSSTDPGIGGVRLGEALWYRPRVADSDLLAISTVARVSDVAVIAMEFVPV